MLKSAWECPSNIALVKYWGKYDVQKPRNPSLSFTLSESKTETSITLSEGKSDALLSTELLLEGKSNEKFKAKIDEFLKQYWSNFSYLKGKHLLIETRNSFPHSAGIASSASGMGALICCLADLEQKITGEILPENEFWRKVSFFSRLASGSACRSVFPYCAAWGRDEMLPDSSEEYAVSLPFSPIFKQYRDCILIVSAAEKSVSSRAGHALMNNNPFAELRYDLARKNFHALYAAMQNEDLKTFVKIVENEALMLHSLMMLSEPSFILMQPATLSLIEKIRDFRAETGLPVCFTLDAGPNIHLLYPQECEKEVRERVENDFVRHCEGGKVIFDRVGEGAKKL